MDTLERIQFLIENHDITAAKLLRDTKLNHSSINSWKKGIAKPSYGALVKIADYFNVSVEYLACKTDDPRPAGNPAPYVSPDELAIVEKLRAFPPDKRKMVETLLNHL